MTYKDIKKLTIPAMRYIADVAEKTTDDDRWSFLRPLLKGDYDIHGREVLFFCSVPDTTRQKLSNAFNTL
jgi:hypothetical protein